MNHIEINNEEKINIMLLNVIKMLSSRGYIDLANIDTHYKKLENKQNQHSVYNISTDTGTLFMVKIVQQKISTINKVVGISDFLNNNADTKKILIVYGTNINKKAYKQIIEYPNTEIFWDFELMLNIIDHEYQPKFELLTQDELEEFNGTYITTKREIPKMERTDIIARYYNLKVDDIIRIIRPSTSSGYTVSYRIVINSPIGKLFDR